MAAPSARPVIAKLTQGPQSTAPKMIAIAKSGQNDLPIATLTRDRTLRILLRSSKVFSGSATLRQLRERVHELSE
jgi:hypothetical protein